MAKKSSKPTGMAAAKKGRPPSKTATPRPRGTVRARSKPKSDHKHA